MGDPAAGERLESWKEIAAYLKRDESTVRRWETEGLPVHRIPHKKKATVFAYKSELDNWWHAGQARLESVAVVESPSRTLSMRRVTAAALVVAVGLAVIVGVRSGIFVGPRTANITSIAVLPLENVTGDPSQDYFADGMTEALITELGKISALRVLSHQTISTYRHALKPLPDIARELNVDALIEGTVLRSGDRLRITASLVQAVPERHLWAESYDFDRRDVLGVQSAVARDVAGRIRINVTPQEQARLTTMRRVDPEAHEAWLLGRAYQYKDTTRSNWAQAKAYYEAAIAKDPNYGAAYASLAELCIIARGAPASDRVELRQQGRQWAAKALALDAGLAEAHNALARAAQQEWDWAGAEREYRLALDVNPNYPVARVWYATFLYAQQRFDEALVHARMAQQIDPASPLTNTFAGNAYLLAGREAEAWASWRKALDLDPNFTDAIVFVARTHVAQGKYADAIAVIERVLAAKTEREPLLVGALAHAYGRAGDWTAASTLIAELERRDATHEWVPPFAIIWAYAGVGDSDRAFARLDTVSRQQHADRMIWLNVDSFLDPLKSNPRFAELQRRVAIPIHVSRAQ